MAEIDVQAFHRSDELVLFNDGKTAPVTNWADSFGDECGPFDNPVTAVAGPDAEGNWHVFVLSEFDPVEAH